MVTPKLLDRDDVLLDLGGSPPVPWHGVVVGPAGVGPLCADGIGGLTVWAPARGWPQAFTTLALCKSVLPEHCVVLTDEPPPLELVPGDGRIAVVREGRIGPLLSGCASYACADLRGDRIFRLLLSGRAWRRPELEPLVGLHQLTHTPRGREVMDRWRDTIPTLFAGLLQEAMPAGLRDDLESLADAARQTEHAVLGGFHALDPLVRGACEWEAGARRYLPLAVRVPEARAAVVRWLVDRPGWAALPPARQEALRLAAARILQRLVDDPWPSSVRLTWILAP